MKTVITVLTLFFANLIVGAQENTSLTEVNTNQLNIGYVNVFELSDQNDLGIGYKYYLGNGALRIRSSLH